MNGVLNILKPPAMSSGAVVGAVKRILNQKKVGHTGTLDPGAAGVLPVCVGRATKLADYIMNGEKEYLARLTFGMETDTLDSYGNVLKQCDKRVHGVEVESVLPEFVGSLSQQAPMFSAIKHNGKKLYEYARKGVLVEKPPRLVRIHEIQLVQEESDGFMLRVRCSKGTYIRTLLADIARRLGTVGYTSFLLRTQTCGYRVEHSVTLDELAEHRERAALEDVLIPMYDAVDFLPELCLDDYLFPIVISGSAVDTKRAALRLQEGGAYRVMCKGVFVGIGQETEGLLKMATMLAVGNQKEESGE